MAMEKFSRFLCGKILKYPKMEIALCGVNHLLC